MFRLMLIVITLFLTACVGPLVPVVKVDKESVLRLQEEVKVLENKDLQDIDIKRLGQIKATSCMNKLWDPPSSKEDAIDQLRYKASSLGANAITNLICEDREAFNIAKNCWNSVTCYAAAISVSESSEKSTPRQHATTIRQPSGSGFVVSPQGHVITNNHVVEGCTGIMVSISGTTYDAQVVRTDTFNDLALLKVANLNVQELSFRSGKKLRIGENIVVLGFPLSGILSQEPHVTSGTVTALAGIKDDTRFLQISAPVQPGNSGGPLLDDSGNILGVVVSKLDAIKVAMVTGDLPQNVNFAINASVVKSFLDANGIDYSLASSDTQLSVADVAEKGRESTVFIQCNR